QKWKGGGKLGEVFHASQQQKPASIITPCQHQVAEDGFVGEIEEGHHVHHAVGLKFEVEKFFQLSQGNERRWPHHLWWRNNHGEHGDYAVHSSLK
ncbi:hypothetical protein CEXT_469851, partial [Caerostris extrusa]